jgi:hypothetical protein
MNAAVRSLALCLLMIFMCTVCSSQTTGSPVVTTDAPGPDEHTMIPYKDGLTTYYCFARQVQFPASTITQSGISNAASAVVAATAHGLHADASPLVSFTGGTGNWTAVNAQFKATIIDANSFSIPLNSTSLGAVTGTVVVTTQAPRLTSRGWRVLKIVVDASGETQSKMWATGGYGNACSDRATLSYQ